MGKADLHMHSTISDGILTPQMLVDLHRGLNQKCMKLQNGAKGIDVIAITDHDEIKGAIEAAEIVYKGRRDTNLEVIIGEEVTTLEGHVLAINIKEKISSGMSAAETITAIHEQNGLAIAAHPYTIAHYLLKRQRGLKGVGRFIYKLPFDGVEVINANITEIPPNIWLRYTLNGNKSFALLGSSDAHFTTAFTAYSEFEGTSAQDLLRAIKNKATIPRGHTYSWFDMARGYKHHQKILEICKRNGSNLPNADIWERAMNPFLFTLLHYTSKLY